MVVAEVEPVVLLAIIIVRVGSIAIVLAGHTIVAVILDDILLHRGAHDSLTCPSVSIEDKRVHNGEDDGVRRSSIAAAAVENLGVLGVFTIWFRRPLLVATLAQERRLVVIPSDASWLESRFRAKASLSCNAVAPWRPLKSYPKVGIGIMLDTVTQRDCSSRKFEAKALDYAGGHIDIVTCCLCYCTTAPEFGTASFCGRECVNAVRPAGVHLHSGI